jgi:hypothetical protein
MNWGACVQIDCPAQTNVDGVGAMQVAKLSKRFAVRAAATEESVDVEAIIKDLSDKVG